VKSSLKSVRVWFKWHHIDRVKYKSNPAIMLDLNHKKLTVWKKSKELVKQIYVLTGNFPSEEKFGMGSQLRMAALSVPSNISEGASRRSKTERERFYEIARSSLVEIDTQIEISLDLEYLDTEDIDELIRLANKVFAMLSVMIKTK
jgi:four helix bundle protein